MTIAELGSVGELVGAIATVATLAYLAIQIRSTTRAVRTASAQSVHESFATWYRMLAADSELSDLTTKGLRDYSSLTESEKGRFISVSMAILLCSQDAFIKWSEGSLSQDLWSGWEFVIMNLLLAPGAWRQRLLEGAWLPLRRRVSRARRERHHEAPGASRREAAGRLPSRWCGELSWQRPSSRCSRSAYTRAIR
jgi:hypothetical protein